MTDTKKIVEAVDYDVTLVIRLNTHVYFAPAERDGPITKSDAIANAWGKVPTDFSEALKTGFGGEFDVDYDAETLRED